MLMSLVGPMDAPQHSHLGSIGGGDISRLKDKRELLLGSQVIRTELELPKRMVLADIRSFKCLRRPTTNITKPERFHSKRKCTRCQSQIQGLPLVLEQRLVQMERLFRRFLERLRFRVQLGMQFPVWVLPRF
jgi:hypothetical protein